MGLIEFYRYVVVEKFARVLFEYILFKPFTPLGSDFPGEVN